MGAGAAAERQLHRRPLAAPPEELLELGGYTKDHRLYGWEDYDLWCRCAERGHRGLLVPEILARYKRSEYSVLSVTDVDTPEAEAILREQYPTVMREPSA